ncbi:DUF1707 SHOCT-like domain-containing protein [Streptomyces sp. G45]|uniref:DUF1707 SHOCT-like domain-containing protein n=1 Tax=Streptomyces sp. G45 TaxID=3406627 RepID=UPI003C14EA50
MTSLPKDPSTLLGDDDRDAAARRLREAYATGHLSHEEMEERLDQVLTARTSGDLASALASLPKEKEAPAVTIAAASGRIQRRGAWRVPRVLKVESALGKVDLDLSQAVLEHPVVDIELQLGTGGARITVPRDATVEVDELRAWKAPRLKARPPSGPGGPTIRISGAMGFGQLKIRYARR